ncbi:hypothetical protein A2U01_0116173, partial [Trifolium medium]|nr:hypothetical protein [Trifolium medium]
MAEKRRTELKHTGTVTTHGCDDNTRSLAKNENLGCNGIAVSTQ